MGVLRRVLGNKGRCMMSKPTTKPIAYGLFTHGVWQIFCPECWGKLFGWFRDADADLIDGNGDTVTCLGCGKECK